MPESDACEATPKRWEVNEVLSLAHVIADLCLESKLRSWTALKLSIDIAEKLIDAQMSEEAVRRGIKGL